MNNIIILIYAICVIAISVFYAVSVRRIRRGYADRLDREVDYISDKYEEKREALCHCIDNLKVQRSELKVEIERKDGIITELETKLLDVPTWRLSSDELPETNDRMLVCSTTTKGDRRINIAWYGDGKWHGNGNLDNVTAWMPLPEPPECGMRNAECGIEGAE